MKLNFAGIRAQRDKLPAANQLLNGPSTRLIKMLWLLVRVLRVVKVLLMPALDTSTAAIICVGPTPARGYRCSQAENQDRTSHHLPVDTSVPH
jgi:hypothetical protein